MRNEKDLVYSNLSPLDRLDIYYAKEDGDVIIYFHGGGLHEGDKYDSHIVSFAESFANKGYTFVNVDYSLYPNTKFPNYLIEAAKAVKFACDHLKIKHPYIAGTSAGAYIAFMLCFNTEYLLNEGINPLDIKGWIFESGQPTSHFNVMHYEKGLDPLLQRIDEYAPLYYVNKDTKLSKALFILYDNDLPNRYEQNQLMIKCLQNYNQDVNVEQILLKGYHCEGSSHIDQTGDFPFVYQIINWINK